MSSGLYLSERESAILGQEFLTWLWYKSESRDGRFKDAEGTVFTCRMEQKVSVEGGEGDSKETATVSGAHSELNEARLGLRRGKKVTRALLRFELDSEAWTLTLKAEDFALGSLKTPKVEKPKGGDDDPDGAFFEKIFLIEKVLSFLDALYREYLGLRLSSVKWPEEVEAFKVWLTKS